MEVPNGYRSGMGWCRFRVGKKEVLRRVREDHLRLRDDLWDISSQVSDPRRWFPVTTRKSCVRVPESCPSGCESSRTPPVSTEGRTRLTFLTITEVFRTTFYFPISSSDCPTRRVMKSVSPRIGAPRMSIKGFSLVEVKLQNICLTFLDS